jgi:D-glycero-alpha-D-manno-heptose 1-phosphate guanylyltransferase
MQAIVLAGGLGTRLRGVVPDLPKPMAPVAARPFLAWVLDSLVDAGFDRVVLAVGYRHEAIRDHFGNRYRALPLAYSVEDQPLGTGGAIRLAAEGLPDGPFFVLNGDTFVEVDYTAMHTAHVRGAERMSMAVCRVTDAGRYGALDIDSSHVRGFHEKGRGGPGAINAGTYLLSPEVLRHIPRGEVYSFEQQVIVPMVQALRPAAFEVRGLFIDIGVPEDYARAQQLFTARGAET